MVISMCALAQTRFAAKTVLLTRPPLLSVSEALASTNNLRGSEAMRRGK